MATTAGAGVRVSVPDDQHLETLLDEAEGALNRGENPLAITHLLQAVFVAHVKDSRLSELELLRRVKNIGAAHGGVA
jgi:hypothetical protein